MATIFITSFHPLISRNILSTGLLEILKEKYKVVILAPSTKKEYFAEEFGGQNIFIEGFDIKPQKKDLFFRKLFLSISHTETLYIKKRSDFYENKNIISFLFSVGSGFLFYKSKLAIKLFRWIDFKFFRTNTFDVALNNYRPDLIFATDLQNEFDVR